MLSDVVANGDLRGDKTEALVSNVFASGTDFKVLEGGKYGRNNGLDLVAQYVDPETGKTMTMVIDSKQLAKSGATGLDPKAAGSVMQLSDASIRTIAGRLEDNATANALEQALDSGTLVKAVTYVDKSTGQLKIVRVNVPNRG